MSRMGHVWLRVIHTRASTRPSLYISPSLLNRSILLRATSVSFAKVRYYRAYSRALSPRRLSSSFDVCCEARIYVYIYIRARVQTHVHAYIRRAGDRLPGACSPVIRMNHRVAPRKRAAHSEERVAAGLRISARAYSTQSGVPYAVSQEQRRAPAWPV